MIKMIGKRILIGLHNRLDTLIKSGARLSSYAETGWPTHLAVAKASGYNYQEPGQQPHQFFIHS